LFVRDTRSENLPADVSFELSDAQRFIHRPPAMYTSIPEPARRINTTKGRLVIDCGEREDLRHTFELAVVAALTENARLNSIKLPSDKFAQQLERTLNADKRELEALSAYTEHIRTHRCLG
jgi:hypothetical protein